MAVTRNPAALYSVTVAAAGAYTIAAVDDAITFTNAAAATANLPTLASSLGREIVIQQYGAGIVTIDGNGAETINGATTLVLAQFQAVVLLATATDWMVVATYGSGDGYPAALGYAGW